MNTPEMSHRTAASRDFWERRYAAAVADASPLWSVGPNAWVEAQATDLPPGRAADVGAGECRNALWLASRGWQVEAVDFSPSGLAAGRERARTRGLQVAFTEADATTWRADPPVDLVVMAYLQLPVDDTAAAVRSALSSLAPGGRLLLVAHDRDNLTRGVGGPQDPAILTTPAELRAAVDGLDGNGPRGIDVLECGQVDRVLPDGRVAVDVVLVAVRT